MINIKEDVPLCVDCKHSFIPAKEWILLPFGWWPRSGRKYFYRCRRLFEEKTTVMNPVIGEENRAKKHLLCESARDRYNESCGPLGKMWIPKHKKHLFMAIKRADHP